MPIRDPTQAEREYLGRQRAVKLKASYGRGLPKLVVWLAVALLAAAVAAAAFALLD